MVDRAKPHAANACKERAFCREEKRNSAMLQCANDFFSVPTERAAVTTGGNLRVGGTPPTSIFAVSKIAAKL